MAFGNVSVDTGSFAQPDTSRGLLANFMLMQQLRNGQLEQQRFQSDQDKEQRIQQAMSGFDPANPESGLAAIYQADPERAAKVHASIAERRKLEAEAQKVGFEAQRAGLEAQGAQATVPQEFKTGLAKQFGSFWHGMPPNQRDPRLADRWLDSKIQEAQQLYPQWAPAVEAIRSNPDWINHARSLTPDPYEADQREVSKYQQQRQFDNQLPPTPYQQSQLEQQGRTTSAEVANKSADRANSLRKQFEGLEEVTTFRAVAPMMEGLRHSASLDNKAGDLGLIYGVARVLDPKGVVRESDAGLVGGTGSWFEDLAGKYNAVQGGARLSPDVRAKLLDMAYGKTAALKQAYDTTRDQYAGIAARQGVAPEDMGFGVMDMQRQAPQTGNAPQGGEHPAIARARALIAAHPEARSKVIMSLQRSGIDATGL